MRFHVRTYFGYFCGELDPDGYWYIETLLVKPRYRKQGLGRKLLTLLPRKCRLVAAPILNSKCSITREQLQKFYKSAGFKFSWCKTRGMYLMQRSR